jgi:hypothetical protein
MSLLNSKHWQWILPVLLLWIVASAAFSGFIAKWGFRDGVDRMGIEKIIDGTAHKPFVYRQLLPSIANAIADRLPTSIVEKFEKKEFGQSYSKIKLEGKSGEYKFKYLFIYVTCFLSLFLGLVLLYHVLISSGYDNTTSLLSVIAFGLSVPYFETGGGYFYDFPEMFFMFLTAYLAIKDKKILLLLAITFATLNKESFLLFVPMLLPLVKSRNSLKHTLMLIGAGGAIALLINLVIKYVYQFNDGGVVEIHFFNNIVNYLNPLTYLGHEFTYGVPSPEGLNVLVLILLAYFIYHGFSGLQNYIKHHILIALTISLSVFLLFSATNELRNLSFMYLSLTFLIAQSISHFGAKNPINNLA